MNLEKYSVSEADLHAYVDGQLPADRRAEVERTMAEDLAMKERVACYLAINRLVRGRNDPVIDEAVPSRLIFAVKGRWRSAANAAKFSGMAASLLLGIGIGFGGHFLHEAGVAVGPDKVAASDPDVFARQSAIAHVTYAPDVERPENTSPLKEHELAVWLSTKLKVDVVPPVLVQDGYRLMGGRVLAGGAGPFAQFTYNDSIGDRITLCVSHQNGRAQSPGFLLYKDGPVKVFHWTDDGYGYSVTGGINKDDLLLLAHKTASAIKNASDHPRVSS
jgi:anti-sigma factor RsiW